MRREDGLLDAPDEGRPRAAAPAQVPVEAAAAIRYAMLGTEGRGPGGERQASRLNRRPTHPRRTLVQESPSGAVPPHGPERRLDIIVCAAPRTSLTASLRTFPFGPATVARMSSGPMRTDVVEAITAAALPLILGVGGLVVTRRQNLSAELIKARLDYYRTITPKLNLLMSYITFIGRWRDQSPPAIIELKRRLAEEFFVAAPLFNKEVLRAYDNLMALSFNTFGDWGQDARIVTSGYRRRQSWKGEWDDAWDSYFAVPNSAEISRLTLRVYRENYDALLAAMAKDMEMTRARAKYTTDEAVLNAHAQQRTDIAGTS